MSNGTPQLPFEPVNRRKLYCSTCGRLMPIDKGLSKLNGIDVYTGYVNVRDNTKQFCSKACIR